MAANLPQTRSGSVMAVEQAAHRSRGRDRVSSPDYPAPVTTYTLRSASPAKTRCDAVVVGVVQTAKGAELADGGADVAAAYGRKLRPLLSTLGVTGKAGEVVKVPTSGAIASPLLVLVGLGKQVTPTPYAAPPASPPARSPTPPRWRSRCRPTPPSWCAR